MYKKLVALQSQLQTDKKQLETEVATLQAIIDEPDPQQFDEYAAASRITAAKSKDHLEDTKTANKIIKEVDKAREETGRKLKSVANQKMEAQQQLAPKQAQLVSIDHEITALDWKIKALVDEEAKQRLATKITAYRQSAAKLLNVLIEIDALNAVIAENPNENPAKYTLLVEPLPAIDPDSVDGIDPWQLQAAGEKFVFTREAAFLAVHERHLAIIEEIRGNLHGK